MTHKFTKKRSGLSAMDPEEVRAILSRSRCGIWALIDAAVKVASSDYGEELLRRRDKIVELLYAPGMCRSCNGDIGREVVEHEPYFPENICNNNYNSSENIDNCKCVGDDEDDDDKKISNHRNSNEVFSKSPLTPESDTRNLSDGEEEEDVDPYSSLFDDEQTKIQSIKEQLEDINQSEDTLVELLQNLADMDITFQALEETDIGRHVNRLRKHSSNEVNRLVKQLVRKWKETVDEWVKGNHRTQATPNLSADGDSPQQNMLKNQQNGHHQVPDFGCSPKQQNGSSSQERKYVERETKPKPPQSGARREAPSKQSVPEPTLALPNRASQRRSVLDDEKLNSARKRLQENYQEAQNAKMQRTIQVMDIHDIPKPKNAFFAKNKGGFQGRHHR